MKQFQVPQFIDVEDKIVGPLTLKQFLYLLAGGALVVIARALFIPFIFYIVAFFLLVISLALAFYKPNDIPFPKVLMSAISFFTKPRLYIWKQEEISKKPSAPAGSSQQELQLKVPAPLESKLEDLAWSLDIKEKIEEREEGSKN